MNTDFKGGIILCKSCLFINSVFTSAKIDSYLNYMPVLMLLREIEKQKRIQMVAGDCPIEDTLAHIENETHYTIRHYFFCEECEQFFLIGACIRGAPVYKNLNTLKNEDLEKTLWGRCGKLFQ